MRLSTALQALGWSLLFAGGILAIWIRHGVGVPADSPALLGPILVASPVGLSFFMWGWALAGQERYR